MRFLFLSVEAVIMLLFLVTFVTQIIVPVWRNQKLFPILRRKSSGERLLDRADQEIIQAEKGLEAAQRFDRARQLEQQADRILFKE